MIHRQICDHPTWDEIKRWCHLHVSFICFVPKTSTRFVTVAMLMAMHRGRIQPHQTMGYVGGPAETAMCFLPTAGSGCLSQGVDRSCQTNHEQQLYRSPHDNVGQKCPRGRMPALLHMAAAGEILGSPIPEVKIVGLEDER